MSVDYFICENCNEAHSEYDRIICENEHYLCSGCLPEELSKIGICDDIHLMCNKEYTTNEILQKYIVETDEFGWTLKKEFCPVCQREERNKKDPEYKEYLRLKKKFEED